MPHADQLAGSAGAAGPGRAVLVVGASTSEPCGVRDYAERQCGAFRAAGLTVTTAWWERDLDWSLAEAHREWVRWSAQLAGLRDGGYAWVLVHYSAFSWGYRGLPVWAPALATAARHCGPVVYVLHELVYPFRGLSGKAALWAMGQRAALLPMLLGARGAVVTTEGRSDWLAGRRWLPRRPVTVVPVPSTLPPGEGPAAGGEAGGTGSEDAGSEDAGSEDVIGVFGYGAEGFDPAPVLATVTDLHARGLGGRLRLIGAPGPDSPAGRRWRAAAQSAGVEGALEFTGVLPIAGLRPALEEADVIAFPDRAGPSTRKSTLAGVLDCGRPVVALDGPERWDFFVDQRAVVVCPAAGMAGAIGDLLADAHRRRELGGRAQAFYHRWMDLGVTAGAVRAFADRVTSGTGYTDAAAAGPVGAAPGVSVLLAAYSPTYLRAAIDSVLGQTFADFELLVLDDSPAGEVAGVVAAIDDARVRYFPSERLGVARNHDRGMRAARGRRLAIINHDDEWCPTLLAELTEALDACTDAVVAFSDHWVIDGGGAIDVAASQASSERWGRAGLRPGLHRPFGGLAIGRRGVPIAQCAVWRRAAVPGIPGWAGDRYDYWLQVRLALSGLGAVYVPERLARFRVHGQNLGSDRGLRRRVESEAFYRRLLCTRGLGEARTEVARAYGAALVALASWPLSLLPAPVRQAVRRG
ncbi:MAG TPA: glycosyltransferase [Actinomycetota bacterium]|nr:glycosyltransferase [Actinomycetota bacterium]